MQFFLYLSMINTFHLHCIALQFISTSIIVQIQDELLPWLLMEIELEEQRQVYDARQCMSDADLESYGAVGEYVFVILDNILRMK